MYTLLVSVTRPYSQCTQWGALLDLLLLSGTVHVFDWGCHSTIFIIALVNAVHFPLLAVTQGVDGVLEVLFHVSRDTILHFGGWNGE